MSETALGPALPANEFAGYKPRPLRVNAAEASPIMEFCRLILTAVLAPFIAQHPFGMGRSLQPGDFMAGRARMDVGLGSPAPRGHEVPAL